MGKLNNADIEQMEILCYSEETLYCIYMTTEKFSRVTLLTGHCLLNMSNMSNLQFVTLQLVLMLIQESLYIINQL